MIRGIQTAMGGMRAHLDREDVVARNLDNILTPGYKEEAGAIDGFAATLSRVESRSVDSPTRLAMSATAIGSLGVETAMDRVSVNFRQGPLEETHRPLDVALVGDGFLQAMTPQGPMFFRGGPLYRDADSKLVTSEGYPVLDSNGQDLVLRGNVVSIAPNGAITVDNKPAGNLSLVEFAPGTELSKVGDEFYTPDSPSAPLPVAATNTTVKQGYLEGSNVDEVSAMTELVSLVRAYQASQRMLQAEDELLGKAVNDVGRVA